MKNDKNKIDEKLRIVRELEAQRKHQEVMYSSDNINVSLYHIKRKEEITKILKKFVRNLKFLDVGCAEGVYCQLAKNFGAKEVVGVDISETKIKRANQEVPECEFYVADVTNSNDMKKFYNKFDFILCSELLQHIMNYNVAVWEIVKCSTNKGIVLITVPDYAESVKHEMAKISVDMSAQDLLYEIGGAGFGRQIAIWKFNASELEKELRKEFHFSLLKSIQVGPLIKRLLKGRCNFKITLFQVNKGNADE